MAQTSSQKTGVELAYAERANEKLVLFLFTTKATRPHTPKEEALRLIYTEILLSGSGKYDRTKFLDTLSILGSSINLSHGGDLMHFSLQTTTTHRKATLGLFETMLMNPHLTQSELTRIKGHLTNMLILAQEDARSRALQGFITTLTETNDPLYTHDPKELINALKTCTQKELSTLHNTLMHGFWTCTIGGDTDTLSEIQKSIQKLRKKYSFVEHEGDTHRTKTITGRVLKLIDIPSKHNIEFSIGSNLPLTQRDSDYPAFLFGMSVLALTGGFAGRLMSIVREKEGLTYMIYGQLERLTGTRDGFWRITTFFNPKDVITGITSTLREIERIKKKGITEDELARFKAILHTRFTMVQDSLFKQVRQKHTHMLANITEAEAADLRESIQTLTRDAVNAALNKYLDIERMVISGAGPVAQVQKALTNLIQKK